MIPKSLSLNEYYGLFNNYLSILQRLTDISSNYQPFQAAKEICLKGFQLEKQVDPYKMKSLAEAMEKLSTQLGRQYDICLSDQNSKSRQYFLPEINELPQLLFAIVYLKHLLNYQNVKYDGSITTYWGTDARSNIIEGIDNKKPWNLAKFLALEDNIKIYCLNNKVDFDFIKEKLKADDFIQVIYEKISPCQKSDNECSLDELESKKNKLQALYIKDLEKFEVYATAFFNLEDITKQNNRANSKKVSILDNISKIFVPDELSIKLQKAKDKLSELTPSNKLPVDYIKQLNDVKQISSEKYNKILAKHWHLKTKQAKKDLNKLVNNQVVIEPGALEEAMNLDSDAKTLSKCCGFFKLQAPSPSKLLVSSAVVATSLASAYYFL